MNGLNCPHESKTFIPTPELTHYGKEVCTACGKFLGWIQKPETVARIADNARRLVVLRKESRLSDWEKGFVESLEGQGPKISPRQQAKLDAIAQRYGC